MVKFTLKGISNLTESPAYFQQVNGIYRKDGALSRLNKDLFETMPTKIVDSIIMEAIALIEDDEPRKSAYLKTLFHSSSGLDYLRTAVNKSTYKNPILLDALLDQRRPDLSCRKSRYEHTTSAEIVVELIDSLQEQVQIEQPGVSVQYQHDLKIIQKVLDSFFVQIWKFYIGIIVCHKSMMCAL